jgi:hypothetical protein
MAVFSILNCQFLLLVSFSLVPVRGSLNLTQLLFSLSPRALVSRLSDMSGTAIWSNIFDDETKPRESGIKLGQCPQKP